MSREEWRACRCSVMVMLTVTQEENVNVQCEQFVDLPTEHRIREIVGQGNTTYQLSVD